MDKREMLVEEYEGSEVVFEFKITYKELLEMLLYKDYDCRLNIILHDTGWAWCELIYKQYKLGKTVEKGLTIRLDNKEECYDFVFYFADLENVQVSGELHTSGVCRKIEAVLEDFWSKRNNPTTVREGWAEAAKKVDSNGDDAPF